MKVYRTQKNITVQVQPGTKHPETAAFLDAEKNPILFSVLFENNVAKVIEPVGKYMIAEKLAYPSLTAAMDAEPRIVVPEYA